MRTDGPTPPDNLPDPLVEHLDGLRVPALRAARTYIDDRIEYRSTPIRERILAEAAGEVVGIEDHGAYALVRKIPPDQDVTDGDSQVISVYHVTREKQLDDEEVLHWSFLGDVRNPTVSECEHCGGLVDEDTPLCPHCKSDSSQADLPEGSR